MTLPNQLSPLSSHATIGLPSVETNYSSLDYHVNGLILGARFVSMQLLMSAAHSFPLSSFIPLNTYSTICSSLYLLMGVPVVPNLNDCEESCYDYLCRSLCKGISFAFS